MLRKPVVDCKSSVLLQLPVCPQKDEKFDFEAYEI